MDRKDRKGYEKLEKMVLDSKAHNEYGTIYNTQEFLAHPYINNHKILTLPPPISPSKDPDEERASTASATSSSPPPQASRDTIARDMPDHQSRQPLIPSPTNGSIDRWKGNNDAVSNQDYDHDDDSSGDDNPGSTQAPERHTIVKISEDSSQRIEPRFPEEKWKTFIASLILLFNLLLTSCTLALVHERVPDRKVYAPLPDTFLDLVPAKDWALDVSEILIMVLLNTAILVLIFHRHRFIVFRRLFLIMSLLYLMRSITMYITVLPVSSKTYYCSPKLNSTSTYVILSRVVQLVSGFGLSINGKHTYCGDYIYSGHTVILVLSYLFITQYSPKKFLVVHWIAWCLALTGIIMVLVAHGHYSVDVVIAYYVTTRLFWTYHTLCNNPNLKTSSSNNFIARAWWFSSFQYFEKNVDGIVPRQYNWPLPWPRFLANKHPIRDS